MAPAIDPTRIVFHQLNGRAWITSTQRPTALKHERGRGPRFDQHEVVTEPSDAVAHEGRRERHDARRHREAQHPFDEPGHVAALVRREREEEARDADRERADDREVAGEERVLPAGDHHRDREERRVHGLGHEEVRRPLDVGDHPPAFGDDAGQRRELAVEQHELRDGTRVAAAPEPIATPMSASFSASASFTPSPVIATT